MPYKVVEEAKRYIVVESRKTITDTTEVVNLKTFNQKDEAKQFMRKLNGGSGFNGWTPNFFLNEVKTK